MFTINVQDQLDLLLETLIKSEVVNEALDEALKDREYFEREEEEAPLDLSIKKEREVEELASLREELAELKEELAEVQREGARGL